MATFTFNTVSIAGLASAMPEAIIKPENFSDFSNDNEVVAFQEKAGIKKLYRSDKLQTTSDLGFVAADKLLNDKNIDRENIGVILFISKTSDYRSPATAIVLQKRLDIPVDCIGYDINIGAVGFVYGLQVASSLLSGLNKKYALVITGDTASKQFADSDIESLRYSDAATAVLLEQQENAKEIKVQTFAKGEGFKSFIMPGGGFRSNNLETKLQPKDGRLGKDNIFFNREEVETFVVNTVPASILSFLEKGKLKISDFDLVAIQQDGKDVVEQIAGKIDLAISNTSYSIYGNTSGSSIALQIADKYAGKGEGEIRVLASSYGEGFSWGVADFYINVKNILPTIYTADCFDDGAVSHEM